MFRTPAIRLADSDESAAGSAWMYEFDWRCRGYPEGLAGANHLLDVPFVFGTFPTPEGRALTGDVAVADPRTDERVPWEGVDL